jgi:hypothetical protein
MSPPPSNRQRQGLDAVCKEAYDESDNEEGNDLHSWPGLETESMTRRHQAPERRYRSRRLRRGHRHNRGASGWVDEGAEEEVRLEESEKEHREDYEPHRAAADQCSMGRRERGRGRRPRVGVLLLWLAASAGASAVGR